MVPYQRTPPSFLLRCLLALVVYGVITPLMWGLERFKLVNGFIGRMVDGQRKALLKNNPFKGYTPTSRDVFVVTFAKSGTNWMLQIAHQLAFRGHGEFEHIHSVVPWPDSKLMGPMRNYAIPLEDPRVWQASPEGKRVIKTHFRWSDIPYSPDAAYLIVIRDPKDVFVSSYHFFLKSGASPLASMSLPSFLDLFLSDRFMIGGSWALRTAEYWAQRDQPNVLICSFKEMRRDLEATVRRVAAVMHVDASPEIVARVTAQSTFDAMKRVDYKFNMWPLMPWGGNVTMIRKGSEGGASELLTAAQERRIDEYFMAELRRVGSDFPYEQFCRISPGVQAPPDFVTAQAG